VRGLLGRGLKKFSFLHRVNDDGSVNDLATPIAMLVYYMVVLFVLIAVLERMGMTNVLEPLKKMATQFVGYLPNIVGAGIVAYVGVLLARIVSDFVGIALAKVDQQIAVRAGSNDVRVSALGKTFVYAAILLPIIVAALGVLDIDAISDPATAMIEKFMGAIPNIIAAAIIVTVTWFVAKFMVQILRGLLESLQVDELPKRMGAAGVFSENFQLSHLICGSVMFFAMLTGLTAAVDKLDISIISEIMAKLLEFGGGILVGGIILMVGNFLASLAHAKLSLGGNEALANIARVAILGLVLAMGLKSMGLADNIVNMAFGFTLGSVAVAAALAFGLGGRDAAKSVSDEWARKHIG
ncbi:MAG: mechanosensitive ion channel, partial [Granulosicoccaceae bacterium]